MAVKINKSKKKSFKKRIIKSLIIAILIFAIIYAVYTIYKLIAKPTDVFMIENGKISLEESVVGYIIRDEEVIQGENYKNGIIQIKAEGQKIGKGENIFRYYNKKEDDINAKIDKINLEIQNLLSNEQDPVSADIKILDKEIKEYLNTTLEANERIKIVEYKKSINSAISKKAKIAGELSPSGSQIKKLLEEKSKLQLSLTTETEYVKSKRSGIVSYRVDDLENVFSINSLSDVNKKKLEDLNLKTGQIVPTNDEKGKVINNFKCYIAVILKSEKAKASELGDVVTLRLSNANEVVGTIKSKMTEEDGSQTIVFEITKEVESLIEYRKISLDVIWWSFTGLKVPNGAIITEEDKNYIIRTRAGYEDKILINVKEANDKYSIITNYTTKELQDMNYDPVEIKNIKSVSQFDQIRIE